MCPIPPEPSPPEPQHVGVFRDGAAPQLALHPSLCRPGCRAPRPEGGGQVLAVALSALLALPLQGVCSYWLIPHGHTPALPATSTPLKTLLSRIPIPDPAGYAIDFQGSTTERQAENKTPAGPKPPVGKAKGADSRDGARTHALVGGRSAQRALGPQGVGTKGPRALSTGCLFWP